MKSLDRKLWRDLWKMKGQAFAITLTGLVAEIVSGISEGEMVIMHPDESIKDGIRVRPR